MADAPILILEHSAAIASLYRRVLEADGLTVEAVVASADPVEAVHRYGPRLLVLDVLPRGERVLGLLDALRADEVARAVPIILTTTSREMAEGALASYNVRAALVKPFELAAFLDLVRGELGRPTMHANIPDGAEPPAGLMAHAERTLALRSDDIVFRLIQRLREESPWRERDDLGLADLIDYVPGVLRALDVRLHYEDAAAFFARHPEALDRTQDHARARRRQGLSLDAMLREYALLREEIWVELRPVRLAAAEADELSQAERAIDGTLDAIIAASRAAFEEEPPAAPSP